MGLFSHHVQENIHLSSHSEHCRIPQLSKLPRITDSNVSDPTDDSTKFIIIPKL